MGTDEPFSCHLLCADVYDQFLQAQLMFCGLMSISFHSWPKEDKNRIYLCNVNLNSKEEINANYKTSGIENNFVTRILALSTRCFEQYCMCFDKNT